MSGNFTLLGRCPHRPTIPVGETLTGATKKFFEEIVPSFVGMTASKGEQAPVKNYVLSEHFRRRSNIIACHPDEGGIRRQQLVALFCQTPTWVANRDTGHCVTKLL